MRARGFLWTPSLVCGRLGLFCYIGPQTDKGAGRFTINGLANSLSFSRTAYALIV